MPAHRAPEPSDHEGRELALYLSVLTTGARREDHLELRWRTPGGMRRRVIPAMDLAAAAALIRPLGKVTDVYTGVALRADPSHGGREGVRHCGLLHAELDRSDSSRRLEEFVHRPTMIVSSGTAGHLHAYWALAEWVPPAIAEAGNRGLAERLGADLASWDAARILRPPGTHSHKHDPPVRVRLLAALPGARYAFAELTHGLQLTVREPGERVRRRPLRTVSARSPQSTTRERSPASNPTGVGRRAARSTRMARRACSYMGMAASTASGAGRAGALSTSLRGCGGSSPGARASR